MSAIWSLVPLPFLKPAWTSGSSQFTYCWSLAWRIMSITLLAVCIRWPKYWSFSFNISPSSEYSRLISFRIDWFNLLAIWRTLYSLLHHHSSKASIPRCPVFFMVLLLQTLFSSVQLLSRVQFFATPWIAARQASLSITNSRSSLRLTSIESVMPSALIYTHKIKLL